MRRVLRGQLGVGLICLIAVSALGGVAAARTPRKPVRTPPALLQIRAASDIVGRIQSSRFARGRRGSVLLTARGAKSLTYGRHGACSILNGDDRLISILRLSTTWRNGKIPAAANRALRLLSAAESPVRRGAGRRCVKVARTLPRIRMHRGGGGFKPVPRLGSEHDQGELPALPIGKYRPIKSIGAPKSIHGDLHSHVLPRGAGIAAEPLTFFRNSDVGVFNTGLTPQEPTTAEGDNVVWYTGNSKVAISTDAGRTFTTYDPSSIVPDNGLPFCCDQYVSFDPANHMFVWVMQYKCSTGSTFPPTNNCKTPGTGSDRLRIAVARSDTLRSYATNPALKDKLGKAWAYWDLTPQQFGEPAGAWFDYSNLSLNYWNVNWSVNIFRGKTDSKGNPTENSFMFQFHLNDLASGRLGGEYITDTDGNMAPAEGLGSSVTYFTGSDNAGQDKILAWWAQTDNVFVHQITHTTIPTLNTAVNGTGSHGGGSSDWYDRFPGNTGRVQSATVSGDTLYVAHGTGRDTCTAKCTSGTPTTKNVFPNPAIFIARYNTQVYTNVGEQWLWFNDIAAGWPALQTDGAGEVGITFHGGAPGHNAQPVAAFLTPTWQSFYAEPEGLPYETGDYYSLRPGRTYRSFVMTGESVQRNLAKPAGSNDIHWDYIEYGRGSSPYVSPPSVKIVAPPNLTKVTAGDNVDYLGQVSDPVDGHLPAGAIVWTEDGSPIGYGEAVRHVENAPGSHLITVTATNGEGKSASASITIRVKSAPSPPGGLQATITAPPDQTFFGGNPYVSDPTTGERWCKQVQFDSSATGGTPGYSFEWDDVRDGVDQGQVAGNESNPTITLCGGNDFNEQSSHDITLQVYDSGGQRAVDTIRVYVYTPHLG